MIQRSYTVECDAAWCRTVLTVPARNRSEAEETLRQKKWVVVPHRQTKGGKLLQARHEYCCVDHRRGRPKAGEFDEYQPKHLGIHPLLKPNHCPSCRSISPSVRQQEDITGMLCGDNWHTEPNYSEAH